MTDWEKVQGSQEQKPAEFDTASSEFYIYQRRNVQRVKVKNTDETESELWEYEERKLTRDEYSLARELSEQSKSIAALENALCDIDAGI